MDLTESIAPKSGRLGGVRRPALERFAEKIALTEPVTARENILRGEAPAAVHAKKTHCPEGHPYAGDNLYIYPTTGIRRCRECGRKQALVRYYAKKGA